MPATCSVSVKHVRAALVTLTAMPTGTLLCCAEIGSAASVAAAITNAPAPRRTIVSIPNLNLRRGRATPSFGAQSIAVPSQAPPRTCVAAPVPASEVRDASPQIPDTNVGSKGALEVYDSSAAFRFEVPGRVCGRRCRNFKSAALSLRVGAPAHHFIGGHRPVKTFQVEVAHVVGFDQRLDLSQDTLADQDLAGFRLVAQPRREIGNAADSRVVETAVEPDLSQRRIAERYADAEAERVPALAPHVDEAGHAFAQLQRHAHAAFGMVGIRHRIVEHDEDAVA